MKNSQAALIWIVNILNSKNIPFQISGGLAAKIYGSPRPLNDIDIDIPDKNFSDIYDEVKDYLVYGPENYKDEKWDVLEMILDYQGQEIDITGADSCKVSTKDETTWLLLSCDFTRVVYKDFFGIKVPVMPKEDLIAYKKELNGEHQIIDIEAINKYID